ncbi:glycerol-3-phosphate dehydrogenase [Niveibacterium sp. SC-1]|uniref:glycerol-3-phosphate dehydrogenase n=1 Tax=Niveibacterium sp. SC-1 TaxID=3135646 RepID=UPI00311DDBD7
MELETLTRRFDLAVIGGGINGAGIARDAAGRGLSVILFEQDDLASHTSSASSKLIHGGLRYLEHYEFGLVRKALAEREVLLRMAPHIVRPLRFVVPHDPAIRPAWQVRAGLFLYDHLSRRQTLPASETLSLGQHAVGAPLLAEWRRAFAYSDCWVDDARLVVLNAADAAARGASICTRTRVVGAARGADAWTVEAEARDGARYSVQARALINAAGPWVGELMGGALHLPQRRKLRLVKGSHIVVARRFTHDAAYLLQNPDRRIVFALPYEDAFTLIGTTDLEFEGDPAQVAISPEETEYLCTVANRFFREPLTAADVLASFSGVRPLLDDAEGAASAVTRDYALALDTQGPPLVSIYGGKITTYRRLAEDVLKGLMPLLAREGSPWTADSSLPGGDMGRAPESFEQDLMLAYPWLPARVARRLVRSYGSRSACVLANAGSLAQLGDELFPDLFEAELEYLVDQEFAREVEDVLWRRTHLGLHHRHADTAPLERWLADRFKTQH